ncbi:RagB/SusD family nutrient uptake outer membrane protein [Algoriphagus sp.]|uniref:RagB/SusD family nutrient uptake outer membrane protein n=1 Tax=Algoriphagus sp. TaxID=1872435 RepID=UPI002604187D|nr:RagB/SusD family nutrient uptake outer membrane protein [Algoriphagus sp.]
MKNSYKKLSILFILISCLACHDLLDQNPQINFAPENYFSTENELLTGINATYDPLSSGGGRNNLYWAGLPLFLDFLSDDTRFGGGGGFGEGERVEITANNPFVRRAYLGYFEIVNRANLMLENIPNVNLAEDRRNRYTAEVRFLRAFANYHLTILWGDVPLRTSSIKTFEDGPIGASSQEEIFQSISEDLEFAKTHLPWTYEAEDLGRASKGAAWMLEAKMHLFRKNWSDAILALEQLINGEESPHHLVPNYRDVFRVEFKNHPEHIFSARFAGGMQAQNEGFILEERYGPPNNLAPEGFLPGNSNAIARPTYDDGNTPYVGGLINEYLAFKDPRLIHAYVNFSEGDPANYFCDKFRDTSEHVPGNASTIFPIFRFADALLMYAEALNEQNNGPNLQAYQAINQVRMRANLDAPLENQLDPLAGLDYQSFKEAVYHERRMELAHEGHRWIDLVRTGQMEVVMGAHLQRSIEPFRTIWPIPNDEIDANPQMTQNPGY